MASSQFPSALKCAYTTPERPLTWFITGVSSGIGLAVTRYAQSQGHFVIATSRNPGRTPDLVKEVESNGGRWVQLDVDDQNCGKVIQDLEKEGHQIDVLINNAGFSIHQTVENFTDAELRRMMETLYFGPCRLIRAAVPGMRKRRFGVVVTVSSGAGLEARESMGGYGAAKAALDGITKTLAKEVAEFNVRAFYVSLGSFNTNMGNAAERGEVTYDDDYLGTVADKIINHMNSGNFVGPGDKDKAAKAIFEVVVAKGAGLGSEGETLLPLGKDALLRVEEVRDKLNHALDVFGDIAQNVGVDK